MPDSRGWTRTCPRRSASRSARTRGSSSRSSAIRPARTTGSPRRSALRLSPFARLVPALKAIPRQRTRRSRTERVRPVRTGDPATVVLVGSTTWVPERFRFFLSCAPKRVSWSHWISNATHIRSQQHMSSESFADLGVSRPVLGALAEPGINEPFAVQRLCIAAVLQGEDVLVQSPTGSGKTLAFGIPMVERIQAEARRPASLVLAPTRELAEQIVDELRSIAQSRALKIAPVFGGVGIPAQAKKAAQPHIVVATPGRLEDLLDRGAFNLKQIQMLVLDEADRMLDMGFKPAVDRIVKRMPRERQTLFFSATLEGAAGQLAAAYTQNARRHVHAPKAEKRATEQRIVHLSHEAKVDALVKELRDSERGRTL